MSYAIITLGTEKLHPGVVARGIQTREEADSALAQHVDAMRASGSSRLAELCVVRKYKGSPGEILSTAYLTEESRSEE